MAIINMSTCFRLGLFSLEVIFLLFGLVTITSPLIFFPFPLVSFCKTFAPGSGVMLDLPILILPSVIACWVASYFSVESPSVVRCVVAFGHNTMQTLVSDCV